MVKIKTTTICIYIIYSLWGFAINQTLWSHLTHKHAMEYELSLAGSLGVSKVAAPV